jgi:hypothetical protein
MKINGQKRADRREGCIMAVCDAWPSFEKGLGAMWEDVMIHLVERPMLVCGAPVGMEELAEEHAQLRRLDVPNQQHVWPAEPVQRAEKVLS